VDPWCPDERRRVTKLYRVGEAAYDAVPRSEPENKRLLYGFAAMLLELKSPAKKKKTLPPLPFTAAELCTVVKLEAPGVFDFDRVNRGAYALINRRIRDIDGLDVETPNILAQWISRQSRKWKRLPLPLDVLGKNLSVWVARAYAGGDEGAAEPEVRFHR